ncbi:MAG: DUF378 domain-containing protein [Patescibacteria group bacterium]
MKWLHIVSYTLVIVGALNWGFIGLLDFNLVTWLSETLGVIQLTNIVYIAVGVAAVYEVLTHATNCKTCESMMK